MIRSSLVLAANSTLVGMLAFARNIVIARLVSVEDFGIAGTFATAMAAMEMLSYFALDRLLVQAPDGEEPAVQGTTHSIQAIRGVVGAIMLYSIAGPVAAVFGIPQATWAYQMLALVPLMRGLRHLDIYRFQRQMAFSRLMIVDTGSATASLLCAIPLAAYLQDYRAMLWVILLQQFAATALSHMVAQRPYALAWDGPVFRRAFHFGWPLLVNGVLLFAILQGDRIIIGNLMNLELLGLYSVAFALALAPSSILSSTISTLFLPILSRTPVGTDDFARRYYSITEASLVAGVALALFFHLFGMDILTIMFGPKYAAAGGILGLLAIMYGIRIARVGASTAATATGDTKNPMIANITRASMVPAAYGLAQVGGGYTIVFLLGILGEAVAFFVSSYRLRLWAKIPFTPLFLPTSISTALYAAMLMDQIFFELAGPVWRFASGGVVLSGMLILLYSARHFGSWLRGLLPQRFGTFWHDLWQGRQ